MTRFNAFAPALCEMTPKPRLPHAILPAPRAQPPATSPTPLYEIQAIEEEWLQLIQPAGMVEETLCAQLAHATWHLRCLHRAERESIAAALQDRSFNGEYAMSLMTWRLSAENAVKAALDQLQTYRQFAQHEPELVATLPPASELLALAHGVGRASTGSRVPV